MKPRRVRGHGNFSPIRYKFLIRMLLCDICGAPSNGYECDWPVTGFTEVPVSSLQVGEEVRRVKEWRKTKTVARVAELSRNPAGDHTSFILTLAMQTPSSIRRNNKLMAEKQHNPLFFMPEREALLIAWKADRFKRFAVPGHHVIKASRGHACSKHVCDACMVERDPNRMVICADHWFSWEQVA